MFSDLFDSPWKILIVAVVLVVLFGSKKLSHVLQPPRTRRRVRLPQMLG